MLLCNLNLCDGLCNKTHLIYNDFKNYIISETIFTKDFKNKHVFISQIFQQISQDEKLPLRFKKKIQFSI